MAPLAVNFTDQSSGNVTNWFWDFGDGGNSVLQNPTHIYLTPGMYSVALIIFGPGGGDSISMTK